MFLSLFDMFRVGVDRRTPSADGRGGAHPRARFARGADRTPRPPGAGRLHGSLALTCKGHATDRAVILGLAGLEPASFDAGRPAVALAQIAERGTVAPPDRHRQPDIVNVPALLNGKSPRTLDNRGSTPLTAAGADPVPHDNGGHERC